MKDWLKRAAAWIAPLDQNDDWLTIRQVKDCLSEGLCREKEWPCPSQRAFYRLRRVVTDRCAVERSKVRPRTQWNEIVPRRGQRIRLH